jgi:hypothetical protein
MSDKDGSARRCIVIYPRKYYESLGALVSKALSIAPSYFSSNLALP